MVRLPLWEFLGDFRTREQIEDGNMWLQIIRPFIDFCTDFRLIATLGFCMRLQRFSEFNWLAGVLHFVGLLFSTVVSFASFALAFSTFESLLSFALAGTFPA